MFTNTAFSQYHPPKMEQPVSIYSRSSLCWIVCWFSLTVALLHVHALMSSCNYSYTQLKATIYCTLPTIRIFSWQVESAASIKVSSWESNFWHCLRLAPPAHNRSARQSWLSTECMKLVTHNQKSHNSCFHTRKCPGRMTYMVLATLIIIGKD